ncbi:hypothetical protein FEM48_Zijuj07G0038000 [Ziziphus jujuba var. spinosa]|uniref:Uncharacterized protein n=1 Tax=Ziziphus jujuba var. spinosa TaxID=714518 RepID=A0A978V296_ZIZJJ|nr:hypothetical protein FEM48_Zijuj07G0038000 [Ziziphus jujuba var. spinosa]
MNFNGLPLCSCSVNPILFRSLPFLSSNTWCAYKTFFRSLQARQSPQRGAKPTGFSSNPTLFLRRFRARSSLGDAADDEPPPLVVLYVLELVWIDNSTGFGKAFINVVSGLSDSHEVSLVTDEMRK